MKAHRQGTKTQEHLHYKEHTEMLNRSRVQEVEITSKTTKDSTGRCGN